MTILLCSCGRTFEARIEDGEIQIVCDPCFGALLEPETAYDAPCWRPQSSVPMRRVS